MSFMMELENLPVRVLTKEDLQGKTIEQKDEMMLKLMSLKD